MNGDPTTTVKTMTGEGTDPMETTALHTETNDNPMAIVRNVRVRTTTREGATIVRLMATTAPRTAMTAEEVTMETETEEITATATEETATEAMATTARRMATIAPHTAMTAEAITAHNDPATMTGEDAFIPHRRKALCRMMV